MVVGAAVTQLSEVCNPGAIATSGDALPAPQLARHEGPWEGRWLPTVGTALPSAGFSSRAVLRVDMHVEPRALDVFELPLDVE